MLVNGTPIEKHSLAQRVVWVKREDLSCPAPGPPFSKMRGVVEHVKARPEKVFGVLDTFHSKAGWAVAYACKALGRKCVNYYPVYKSDVPGALRNPQVQSKKLGARLEPLTAGRSAILYHRARRMLSENHRNAYLMPNALKLPESITATAREVVASRAQLLRIKPQHVVVSISSATIAAGVLQGLQDLKLKPVVWLHEGYSRSESAVLRYLGERAEGFDIRIVDEKYAYKDTAPKEVQAPFPCNPWYDLKAWAWLEHALPELPGPVLFWNVGC